MKELIAIENNGGIETVNARNLHEKLGVSRDFSNWIKDRIEKYDFQEGQDYMKIDSPNLANQTGRGGDRRSIDYFLSIDMAKELSMVENNSQGRLIRRWFIEREKQASMITANPTNTMSVTQWALELAIKVLQPDAVGRLTMTRKALEVIGADTRILPDYAPSEGIAKSATELLKGIGSAMSAKTFNQKVAAMGLLENMTRQSSNGGIKQFWHVTEAGQAYGKNAVSPHNPKETQPLWYESSFAELYGRVEAVK